MVKQKLNFLKSRFHLLIRFFNIGYNQILTSLVADKNIFNSNYNKTTFLNNINTFLKQMPDYFVKIDIKNLELKCEVTYFPIDICQNLIDSTITETTLNQMTCYLNFEDYVSKYLINSKY